MPARAVLEIIGDPTSLIAALGKARAASRATAAAIAGDAKSTTRVQERAAATAAAANVRAAQASLRAQMKAYQQGTSAAQLSARARADVEHRATEIAMREARARGLTVQQELDLRRRALNELTSQYLAAEKRMTAAHRREVTERARNERTIQRGLGSGLGAARGVASGAVSVASDVHGQMQAARRARGTTEHTLNAALFQARIRGSEAASARGQVMDFAMRSGMDPQVLAESISAAQSRFSVLAGATPEQRRANLQQQLGLAEFAQSTYQSPQEVMLAAGMLNQQGVTGVDQRDMLRMMTGTAQAGSVELSTVISTGLGPMMRNVSRSVNANMTGEQRTAAVRQAVAQSMAEAEIASAAGLTPLRSMNALAAMRGDLTNTRKMQNLRRRLGGEGEQGQAALAALYGADGTLNTQDPIEFMSRLTTAFGGDTNRVSNLLGAGGPGAPMVLSSPQRDLLNAMASQSSGGGTIAETVQRMLHQASEFTEDNVAQGREMVQDETATQLQRDENARMQALTGNTQAIQGLSNQFAAFQARNPITGAIATAGGAGALGLAARSPTALAGTLLAGGSFANLGAALTGTDASGRSLGLAERFGRGALGALSAIPGVGMIAQGTAAGLGVSDGVRGAGNGSVGSAVAGAIDRLTNLLQSGQVTATVAPHDATQAAATASTQLPRR